MEIRLRYRRYRTLFDAVWQALPAADRAELAERLALVTDGLAGFQGGQRRARVYGMAARMPPPRTRKSRAAGALAPASAPATNEPGPPPVAGRMKVLLRHKWLQTLDDRFVMGVIAHELAHVLCRHPVDGVLWTRNHKEAYLWGEAEANALAQAWGFTPPSLLTGHWATSEYYGAIVRVGLDFSPPRIAAQEPAPPPPPLPPVRRRGRGAGRAVQPRLPFPDDPAA